ncbi:MAG: hypothetical protein M3R48_05625 [Candidatus Dormibacteraeota bacterium]|nr:hypothetical protein [Candidatus Dormibacteraeota bacterium]
MNARINATGPSLRLISLFVATVVVGTAAVVVAIHAISGSWATGGVAGGIAAVITATVYPLLVRRR